MSLFVIDRDTPGLRTQPVKTMDGHHAAMRTFDGVPVGEDRRLGIEGGARGVVAFQSVGAAPAITARVRRGPPASPAEPAQGSCRRAAGDDEPSATSEPPAHLQHDAGCINKVRSLKSSTMSGPCKPIAESPLDTLGLFSKTGLNATGALTVRARPYMPPAWDEKGPRDRGAAIHVCKTPSRSLSTGALLFLQRSNPRTLLAGTLALR